MFNDPKVSSPLETRKNADVVSPSEPHGLAGEHATDARTNHRGESRQANALDSGQKGVTTTLPRARPSPTYASAAGTSWSAKIRSMWIFTSPVTQRSASGSKWAGP